MVTHLLMYPWAVAAVIGVVVLALILGWWAKRPPIKRDETMWLDRKSVV